MKTRVWWGAVFATAVTLVILGMLTLHDTQDARLPARADSTYPTGGAARAFDNIGELAATSRFVLLGEVLRVEQGDPVTLPDGSDEQIIPRRLVVAVREQVFARDDTEKLPAQVRIYDGYWSGGHGFTRESTRWAQPGDMGYFFVTRGRAPDGTVDATFTVLDSAGLVLVAGGRVEPNRAEVWERAGHPSTMEELRSSVASAVSAARSGQARPEFVRVCYPSVPDDENSEPICVKE